MCLWFDIYIDLTVESGKKKRMGLGLRKEKQFNSIRINLSINFPNSDYNYDYPCGFSFRIIDV